MKIYALYIIESNIDEKPEFVMYDFKDVASFNKHKPLLEHARLVKLFIGDLIDIRID